MDTAYQQIQWRILIVAVHGSGGISLSTGTEKDFRDFSGIGRGSLQLIFHAIGGNIMKEGGLVFGGGASLNQSWFLRQNLPEAIGFAVNNGLNGLIKCVHLPVVWFRSS